MKQTILALLLLTTATTLFSEMPAWSKNTGGAKELPVPGQTAAPVWLQKQVAEPLLVAVSAFNKPCKTPFVANTALLAGSKKPSILNGKIVSRENWEELWTIKSCDKSYQAQVTYTPDGQGGAYMKMSLKK